MTQGSKYHCFCTHNLDIRAICHNVQKHASSGLCCSSGTHSSGRHDGGVQLNVFGADLKRQTMHHKHSENVDPCVGIYALPSWSGY